MKNKIDSSDTNEKCFPENTNHRALGKSQIDQINPSFPQGWWPFCVLARQRKGFTLLKIAHHIAFIFSRAGVHDKFSFLSGSCKSKFALYFRILWILMFPYGMCQGCLESLVLDWGRKVTLALQIGLYLCLLLAFWQCFNIFISFLCMPVLQTQWVVNMTHIAMILATGHWSY